ncbi:DUF1905 domain-containing protein [Demequina sp. NBRC 110051]|uniref:DUF1905 domain-containing protein n=1 Tax=Demequina sp. NBRC 110051 TaxID=1570340 RepID=UPI0009FE3DE3|nr:DUF1905 domain-containing protein [Demequina sp. NBRC 110051]
MTKYAFTAPLWVWRARNQTWTFVTVPEDIADEVEDLQTGLRRGFGAVKVRVTIGSTVWETSMFPSSDQGSYILPVKASVRKAEGLSVDGTARLTIELIEP